MLRSDRVDKKQVELIYRVLALATLKQHINMIITNPNPYKSNLIVLKLIRI